MSERGETEKNPGAPFGVDESVAPVEAPQSAPQFKHPKFMHRFTCTFVDVVFVVGFLVELLVLTPVTIAYVVLLFTTLDSGRTPPDFTRSIFLNEAPAALIWLAYFTVMEAGRRRASFGKLLTGVEVVDLVGRRVSFLRALWRNALKLAVVFIGVKAFLTTLESFSEQGPLWKTAVAALTVVLCAGAFLMARFTKRKQALHDILAGTLVIEGYDS